MRSLPILLIFTVSAAGASAQRVPTWHLRLMATVNGSDRGPGMLGNITDLAIRTDGGVYVAEEDPARVTSFDGRGIFVRVMMRDGAGPAEIGEAEITARGDTLVAFDPTHRRLTWLTAADVVVREARVDVDENESRILSLPDGAIFIPAGGYPLKGFDGSMVRVRGSKTDTITWVHPDLEDRTITWRGPHWVIRARAPYSPPGVATFDPHGNLVIGGTKKSEWFVVKGKDTIRTVALADKAVPIPGRVRDSVFAAWYSRLPKNFPDLDKVVTKDRFPTTLPPWVTFDIDPEGRWWVGRPGVDGRIASWDIVDGGKIVAHVAVPARLFEARFKGVLTAFGSGKVAIVQEAEDGTLSIGIYRIVPR